MNILITNLWLHDYAGTEVYVRDLAITLKRIGFQVDVYTPYIGFIGRDMRKMGINVVDSVDDIKNIPNIIHGHHKVVMDVINKFHEVPVVYFCHSGNLEQEEPVIHPNIKKYVAVDEFCMERLRNKKIADAQIIYNWVDTNKLKQKEKINDIPSKALIFSNKFPKEKVWVIQKACDEMKIQLDFLGSEYGNSNMNPETILGNYDIVFAKAKCAMEAMACGCAVILHDYAGLGEMIVPSNFEHARKYNFGFKLLRPVSASGKMNRIGKEIKRYNAVEVKMVSDRIREEASFDKSLQQIITLYNQIVNK